MVPVHELDSMVGELDSDYDFGLGEIDATYGAPNLAAELGRLTVQARVSMPKIQLPKIQMPKISASIQAGRYKKIQAAKKPVKHAPARKAIKRVKAKGKKPVVLARQKAKSANSAAPTLSQIYKALKAQGKIINLLAVKRSVRSESDKLMAQDAFRDSVMSALRKLDKQCSGSSNGNYFARWNKLKKATGVAVSQA
jgi:hypothetical protein